MKYNELRNSSGVRGIENPVYSWDIATFEKRYAHVTFPYFLQNQLSQGIYSDLKMKYNDLRTSSEITGTEIPTFTRVIASFPQKGRNRVVSRQVTQTNFTRVLQLFLDLTQRVACLLISSWTRKTHFHSGYSYF